MVRQETARRPTLRQETATFLLGVLAVCTGVVVALAALVLGFSIESTPVEIVQSAKAHRIAVPAVVALLVGVVALCGRRRRWGLPVACVGAAAGLVAVLLLVVLPSGEF